MPDLSAEIQAAAARPKSATNDQGSVTERDLKDLIEADLHLQGTEAAASNRSGWAGLRMARVVPPGAQ